MDRHAKELEDRVHNLERECESLRRENGWLRGLVVGVAGSGGSPPGSSNVLGTLCSYPTGSNSFFFYSCIDVKNNSRINRMRGEQPWGG